MSRVGRKKSDRRWEVDGRVWASKFEWQVYDSLRASGLDVEICGPGDSFNYQQPITGGGTCLACGSNRCVQDRIYTPDLRLRLGPELGYRYVEVKGHFPKDKRALFRHFRKQNPDVDLVFVLAADHWVTRGKSRLTDYFARYLKTTPVIVAPVRIKTQRIADPKALEEFICDPH